MRDALGEVLGRVTSSSSLYAADMLRSPKNNLRTIDLLYHALGNARISVKRLISYLNEAEPISVIAERENIKVKSEISISKSILTRKSYHGSALV